MDRHGRAVYRIAYRMTGTPQDAEDVVQGTFLKAYRQLGRFESRANFGTWVHRIAVNCAIDLSRSRAQEENAALRAEAVQQLGVMGAHEELWQLSQKESAVTVKKRILQAMFVGGNAARLVELAKIEKDPELRRTAVRNLGVMDSRQTGGALIEIYGAEKDPEVRKAVIQGLFQQSNATTLVDLARKEQDPSMKRDIAQKLSVMGGNPAATAYMLELLNDK